MLDKIQNSTSELISQSQNLNSLDRITSYGSQNQVENDKNFFVDQSDISTQAFEKYQREEDIKEFSKALMNMSEKEANDLVISNALDGTISFDQSDIINELLNNTDLINDISQNNIR